MNQGIVLGLIAFATLTPAAAQSFYPRHNFQVGVGAGLPGMDLKNSFSNRVGISANYGFRFHRNFQADAGFETVFGSAGVEDYLDTEFGRRRIRDFQYFVPLGGRAIIPFRKVQLSAGGGGAYLKYNEQISQPSDYYRLDCPECRSRSGFGYYALLGGRVSLDRYNRFWLGVTSRVYRARMKGDQFGDLPAIRTRDQWVNTMFEFGISF